MSFINLFAIYETPKVRPVRYGTRTKKWCKANVYMIEGPI